MTEERLSTCDDGGGDDIAHQTVAEDLFV